MLFPDMHAQILPKDQRSAKAITDKSDALKFLATLLSPSTEKVSLYEARSSLVGRGVPLHHRICLRQLFLFVVPDRTDCWADNRIQSAQ